MNRHQRAVLLYGLMLISAALLGRAHAEDLNQTDGAGAESAHVR